MTSEQTPRFSVLARDGNARVGELSMNRHSLQTPTFMPVGTRGSVRTITSQDLEELGADIILGNTYHLMLRPGAKRINALGGLHRFMNWPKPILTDSGGYQVFSLAKRRTISEEGVVFQSHIDGAQIELTPERAVKIQHLLGSDITMVLDECTSWPVSEQDAKNSMELSMRWAKRCKEAFKPRTDCGLLGIVQGSVFPNLRHQSV